MTIDTTKLRELAQQATLIAENRDDYGVNYAAFIAAANPATVLQLLDEIDRLRTIEAAPPPPKLSDERILRHLDAILKASGSGLKNYSMHKTIEDMKQAVRAIEREILGG